MIQLTITNQTNGMVPQAWLRRVARVVSQVLKIREERRISLSLVSDREIKRLNTLFLGRRRTTNVLSFGLARPGKFLSPPTEKSFTGEIVISWPTACREARRGRITLAAELALLLVHGLLHLSGYNHEGVSILTAKRMAGKERQILARLAPVAKN